MVSVEYFAGFIDGEGSLTLWRRRKGPSFEYVTRMSVANTYVEVLEEIRSDFGGMLVESIHSNPRWKRQFSLRWAGASAEKLLMKVGPHLRVKARQASALLEFSQYRRGVRRDNTKQGRPLLPDDLQIRETFYWRLRALNGRISREHPEWIAPERDLGGPIRASPICPGYLAGFIDGEGSLMISRAQLKTQRSIVYRGKISIGSTDWHIIDEIHRAFGGIVADQAAPEPHWKNAYLLIWSDGKAESLLSVVEPHLRIKARQASVLREFLQHKRASDQRPKGLYVSTLPSEVVQTREALYQRMRTLNAKGPLSPSAQGNRGTPRRAPRAPS